MGRIAIDQHGSLYMLSRLKKASEVRYGRITVISEMEDIVHNS